MEDQDWDLEFQSLEDERRRTDEESEWYNVMLAHEEQNCFLNVKEQVGPRLTHNLG